MDGATVFVRVIHNLFKDKKAADHLSADRLAANDIHNRPKKPKRWDLAYILHTLLRRRAMSLSCQHKELRIEDSSFLSAGLGDPPLPATLGMRFRYVQMLYIEARRIELFQVRDPRALRHISFYRICRP